MQLEAICSYVDADGNLYIADSKNNRIRKITGNTAGTNSLTAVRTIDIYPNPTTATLNIISTDKINQVTICNILGQTMRTYEFHSTNVQVDVTDFPSGLYLAKINGNIIKKFFKN